jgi:ATP-dependent Lon protease
MFFQTKKPPAAGELVLPTLPLRDLVVFPGMVVPLIVGREKSRNALARAYKADQRVFLSAQRVGRAPDPAPEDIHEIGVVASVIQMLRLPDENLKVLVEGRQRARVLRWVEGSDHLQAVLEQLEEPPAEGPEVEALIRSVRGVFEQYVKLNKGIPPEMLLTVTAIETASKLADTLVGHLNFRVEERQELLEQADARARLETVLKHIQGEVEILQVERKIKTRVKKQMEKTQKEYYLNEQMQAIQKELGEKDEFKSEMAELERRVEECPLSEEAAEKIGKELRKLRMMSPMSAEATVVRNYIDWVLAMPWGKQTEDRLDIDFAASVLDEDHYGLRKVKERILEHLAVASLVEQMKGPILCFVGPPGVGKTSLARSIARATNRNFVRQALGGVRDEAEIRGHRRTYIGALPGKIAQSLKKAGSSNPVFLLDEIDKMSTDFRGDPSAALLEVLDPEQNHSFQDHYLDMDYDLSQVFFVCTANTLSGIPVPLRDRLEVIELSGYTEAEKLAIARRYLVPKQMEATGLASEQLLLTRQAVQRIIRDYTRESGVRNLEREIAGVCRKVAKRVVAKGPDTRIRVTSENLPKVLGVPRHKYLMADDLDQVGVVKGLAVTSYGGEMLNIEVSLMPGTGKLILTGLLGDWLKESATAGLSYIRSRVGALGLAPDFHEKFDLHVHYPGNGLKADGPSAGIAMATAMVSVLTGVPVRCDLAMTGEISLRGRVLAIGGLKEKALAAHRGGVRRILIPKDNEQHVAELPKQVVDALEIVLVGHADEVLGHALRVPDGQTLFRSPPEGAAPMTALRPPSPAEPLI